MLFLTAQYLGAKKDKMKTGCQLFLIILFTFSQGYAQSGSKGNFSGNFQTFFNAYERDDRIGANQEVYLKAQSSVDAWLFLNYEYEGYSFALRFDGFQNSPLLNPQGMYTEQGIGFWQANKDFDYFSITAGYFYDQLATGMLFRAYEDRNIGIDFALQGVRIKAHLTDNLTLKGFSGQQKGSYLNGERFTVSPQVISAFNAEQRIILGSQSNLQLGASALNRVLDNQTMLQKNNIVNSFPDPNDRFLTKYNAYGFNGYGTLNLGGFSLYSEYCYKTPDAMFDPDNNRLFYSSGNIIFNSLSYSKGRFGRNKQMSFGANAQYKRIENFSLRTSPFETLLNGMIAYLPSITRQNTYRLLARYNSVVQELGEQAFQADFIFTPKRGTTFLFNYSYVESLAENGIQGRPEKLFEELYFEVNHKFKKNKNTGRQWAVKGGVQSIFYNQDRYEIKPSYPNVFAITPFAEVTWKYTRQRSFRLETQLLETQQDLGSFINVILEWNIAPKWSFAVGDMVNHKPFRHPESAVSDEIIHYYSAFASYTKGSSQFSLAYIKQVEGVNCTGGICRVEPAFSGLRFTLNTSF